MALLNRSFCGLLTHLATLTRNQVQFAADPLPSHVHRTDRRSV